MGRNIVLIGMPASGKSTIGKLLAQKINYEYYDADKYLEKKENVKISTLFSEKGEEYFRNLETKYLRELSEKNGIINTILNFLHLPSLNIINTPAAIILGMVYNYLPFMVLPIYNVLEKIDDNTINAARDLGANTMQTLTKVIIPLNLGFIISRFVSSLTSLITQSSGLSPDSNFPPTLIVKPS